MKPDIIVPTCKSKYAIAPLMCDLQGFADGCRVMATCTKASAAHNRNIGLDWAESDIVIMCDDDMAGFYKGWWQELIKPFEDKNVMIVSARLLNRDGSIGPMMFGGNQTDAHCTVPRVPTACIAFRKSSIRFDENFIGSGFEDDDFCAQIARTNPSGRVVINNTCRLIHCNEMKNQHGDYYRKNKEYFESKWRTVAGNTARVDMYWNIPQIIHFVWVGSDLPWWARRNIEEFRNLNPGFEIMVHNESALNDCFKDQWDKIKDQSHAFSMQSDLIRLSVLMRYGGWYVDTDFWPLVSMRTICDSMKDMHLKPLLFASDDREIVANGFMGCRAYDRGLLYLIDTVLNQKKDAPEWWDYGTWCTWKAVKERPELYCIEKLSKIIPFTGREKALEAMRSQDALSAAKVAGVFAVHFELQGSLNINPEELCSTQNTDRTIGSSKTSLEVSQTESLSKQEQLTELSPATVSTSNVSEDGAVSAPKQTRKPTKSSKKTAPAQKNIVQSGINQDALSNSSNAKADLSDGVELSKQLSPSTQSELNNT